MGAAASVGSIPSGGVDMNTFKQLAPEHYSEDLFHELKGADELISIRDLETFAKNATDVFLTHDWGTDELGRNNHERVKVINRLLQAAGLRTWFDEEAMHGNIKEQMQKGIDYSSCIVVFITERYMNKVAGKGENRELDNCRYEFNHIANTKAPSRIISVVMEPRCTNQKRWIGIVKSTLQSQKYIDFSSDDANRAEAAAAEIVKMVRLQIPFTVDERMAPLAHSIASIPSADPVASVSHDIAQLSVAPSTAVHAHAVVSSRPAASDSSGSSHSSLSSFVLKEQVTMTPRSIMTQLFEIPGIAVDPLDIDIAIEKLVKTIGTGFGDGKTKFDCFINYRISADADLAEKLYLYLLSRGVHAFLDTKCLKNGERWKDGFLNGLKNSKTFVALISRKALERVRDPAVDHSFDNVLLEYETALDMMRATNNPQFICPLFAGECMPNGHLSKFLDFSPSLYPDSVTAIIPITEAPSEAPRAAKNGKKKMKRRNKPIHDGADFDENGQEY